jgi:hypothetical protein
VQKPGIFQETHEFPKDNRCPTLIDVVWCCPQGQQIQKPKWRLRCHENHRTGASDPKHRWAEKDWREEGVGSSSSPFELNWHISGRRVAATRLPAHRQLPTTAGPGLFRRYKARKSLLRAPNRAHYYNCGPTRELYHNHGNRRPCSSPAGLSIPPLCISGC